MASGTNVSTSSNLREMLYRPGLTHQAEYQTFAMSFFGKEKDSAFLQLDDLSNKRGDKIQYRFSPTDDSRDGYSVGDTIQGTEADIDVLMDEVKIDYLGEAFKNDDPMSQQRVGWDMKQAVFVKAKTWWSRRWEQWAWNQLAGVTFKMGAAGTNYKRTGLNQVTAVDSDHVFRPNARANDGALVAADRMSLDWINELMLRVQSDVFLEWPILPCPDGYWHLVIHPICWRDLRQNTSPGDFQDLQRARLEGGQKYENSAFEKAYSGCYNMVKIHVSNWIPLGQSHSDSTASVADTRRCILVGANSLVGAWGQGYSGEQHLDWTERVFEYKRWGVLVDSIAGFKRVTYGEPDGALADRVTYGSMVLPVYAAA
jgi:hypothetical protein